MITSFQKMQDFTKQLGSEKLKHAAKGLVGEGEAVLKAKVRDN